MFKFCLFFVCEDWLLLLCNLCRWIRGKRKEFFNVFYCGGRGMTDVGKGLTEWLVLVSFLVVFGDG